MLAIHNNLIRSLIKQQSDSIERSSKKIKFNFIGPAALFENILIKKKVRELNQQVLSLCLLVEGISSKAKNQIEDCENFHTTPLSSDVQKLLNLMIAWKSRIEKLHTNTLKNEILKKQLPITISFIDDTINNIFDLLLLFKKANAQEKIETSSLAKYTSRKSSDTLQKIMARD